MRRPPASWSCLSVIESTGSTWLYHSLKSGCSEKAMTYSPALARSPARSRTRPRGPAADETSSRNTGSWNSCDRVESSPSSRTTPTYSVRLTR